MATERRKVADMKTLKAAKAAAVKKRAAEDALRQAILVALADGHSMRDVATAVSLSAARIHQIAHEQA